VGTRDQAFSAGIEKLTRALLFLSMELTRVLMKLLIQTTIAICCLGNYSVLFIFAVICLTRRKFIQYYGIIHNMLKLPSESSKKEKNQFWFCLFLVRKFVEH